MANPFDKFNSYQDPDSYTLPSNSNLQTQMRVLEDKIRRYKLYIQKYKAALDYVNDAEKGIQFMCNQQLPRVRVLVANGIDPNDTLLMKVKFQHNDLLENIQAVQRQLGADLADAKVKLYNANTQYDRLCNDLSHRNRSNLFGF
jgi:hypothetical protein